MNEVGTPSAYLLNLAQSHVQSCSACRRRSSDQARLHAVLDQLRASTSQVGAPNRVETNLLAAFRQSTKRDASFIATNPTRLFWVPAAAFLLLAFSITLYITLRTKPGFMLQHGSVRQADKGPEAVLRHQASPALSDRKTAEATSQSARAGAKPRRPLRPADNLAMQRNLLRRQTTQQVRTPADEQLSLNGGSTVFRVNLPLSSLGAVGVPMYPDLPDRQVTADVAVDPFGAIIAIRLVEMKPGKGGLAN